MQKPLTPEQFQHQLIHWQQQHGRHDLPWQKNPTPYRVLVSEVMLQQTQVTTVIPYFENWMKHFPEVEDLAAAHEDEIMRLWQGLGYYSRARNLHKAAQYILESCQGIFPPDPESLLKIPGVGRYTAGAITSFAYNQYGPIVDGNVKRIFCRFFAIEGQPNSSSVSKQLWKLAEDYTPHQHNRIFAQGLLDLGATVCKPRQPQCENCCFQNSCLALRHHRIHELPTPSPKKVIPIRSGQFLWIEQKNKLLMEKRVNDGIWGALWCLPEIHLRPEQLGEHAQLKGQFKHTFTHYKLEANIWIFDHWSENDSKYQWVDKEAIFNLGLPAPIKKFLAQYLV